MTVAHTVLSYLEKRQVPFEVVKHPHTVSSLRTADKAEIQASRLAKAVLLEDDLEHDHYLVAVVPATHRVDVETVSRRVGRPMHLATEENAAGLFTDCEAGAIPPLGTAYGVETLWEDSLMEQPVLYFEAGDHESLVRVRAKDFIQLLPDSPHGQFSHPV